MGRTTINMLYFLLIIIAIGVLLISDAGKKILGFFLLLAILCGVLYLGFWGVIILIGLLSDKDIQDTILTVVWVIIFFVIAVWCLNKLNVKYKRGDFKKEIVFKKISNSWLRVWAKHKALLITVIVLTSLIIVSLVWAIAVLDNEHSQQNVPLSVGTVDGLLKKNNCEIHRENILKYISNYNDSQKPEFRDSNNAGGDPIINLYVERKNLIDIFYSPKIDSCLYIESRQTLAKRGEDAKIDVGAWGVIYDTWYLIDALTDKEINFYGGQPYFQMIHRGEVFNTEIEANTIINEYR